MLVTNDGLCPSRYGKEKLIQMLPWMTKTRIAEPATVRKVNSRIVNTKPMVSRLMSLESPV